MAKKQNYSYKAHRNDVLTTRMIIIFTLLLVSVFVLFKAREWISVRSWLGPIGDYGYFFTITRLLTGLCLILTALSAIHFAKLKKAGVDESLKVIPSSMLLSVSATVFAVLLAVSAFSYTGIGMSIIFIILVALLYFISVCFPGSYFIMAAFNAFGAFVIYALKLVSPIDSPVLHYSLRTIVVLAAIAFMIVIYKARANGGVICGISILRPDADIYPLFLAAVLFVLFVILGMFEIGSYIVYDVIIALETIIFALFYAIKTLK